MCGQTFEAFQNKMYIFKPLLKMNWNKENSVHVTKDSRGNGKKELRKQAK
jgi:hypothetical protein